MHLDNYSPEKRSQIHLESYSPEKRSQMHLDNYSPEKRSQIHLESYSPEKRSRMHLDNYSPEKRSQMHMESYSPEKRAAKHKEQYNPEKRALLYKKKTSFLKLDFNRIHRFEKEIQFGLSFICICCERVLFKRSVYKVTKTFLNQLQVNNLQHCINLDENFRLREMFSICIGDYNNLKKKHMPSQCFYNNLQVPQTPEELIGLTDLELQLLSKFILFLKVRQLPKTRMTVLNDRVICVPIEDDDVVKTVDTLPRNKNNNGHMWVMYKRQKGKKSYYLSEMVRPETVYRALHSLKKYHPAYKDIKIDQFEILDDLFDTDNQIVDDESCCESSESDDSDCIEDVDDSVEPSSAGQADKVENTDNIFNNHTCLLPDQPQANVFINDSGKTVSKKQKSNGPCIEVAPGENRDLSDWIRQHNFDTTAFFWLHYNGSNGINTERSVALTTARYYDQRVCNQNPQWAENATYIFVAQQHIEKMRVEKQISISLQKAKIKSGGKTVIPMSETMSIFKDIPGTPTYWRNFRNELFARIEQLGPFNFFFTLSCAEAKWTEVITSLLRNQNHKIRYEFEPTDGKFFPIIEIMYRTRANKWRSLYSKIIF